MAATSNIDAAIFAVLANRETGEYKATIVHAAAVKCGTVPRETYARLDALTRDGKLVAVNIPCAAGETATKYVLASEHSAGLKKQDRAAALVYRLNEVGVTGAKVWPERGTAVLLPASTVNLLMQYLKEGTSK